MAATAGKISPAEEDIEDTHETEVATEKTRLTEAEIDKVRLIVADVSVLCVSSSARATEAKAPKPNILRITPEN